MLQDFSDLIQVMYPSGHARNATADLKKILQHKNRLQPSKNGIAIGLQVTWWLHSRIRMDSDFAYMIWNNALRIMLQIFGHGGECCLKRNGLQRVGRGHSSQLQVGRYCLPRSIDRGSICEQRFGCIRARDPSFEFLTITLCYCVAEPKLKT